MPSEFNIAFFGSSLVSAYWNGAATYYRGIIRALAERGHRITFYEPDAFDRQTHRDIPDPPWAKVVVYAASEEAVYKTVQSAGDHDVIVKASGVGVFDELLEQEVVAQANRSGKRALFWDVDAPATLQRLENNPEDPFRPLISQYDAVFTYGGGPRVIREYEARGARRCVPIYNAVDPDVHHPVAPDSRFEGDLNFLGNRMPDREQRVHEFFFGSASKLPSRRFLIGGNGWGENTPPLPNVQCVGHVYSRDHNAFNCSSLAVLNINRQSMADYGYSPATRVFEAAGAGACMISDRWTGIESFLEPGQEVLLADSGDDVAKQLARLTKADAQRIGQAARRRVLAEHTYRHRAKQVEEALHETSSAPAGSPS